MPWGFKHQLFACIQPAYEKESSKEQEYETLHLKQERTIFSPNQNMAKGGGEEKILSFVEG